MPIPALCIDPALAAIWPQTALGCLFYTVEVTDKNPALWEYLEIGVTPPLLATLDSLPLAEMPHLAEARAAYRAFGRDPGKYRVSSEALYRRMRQQKPLYQINSLVDANNLVSVETGFSLGSYDLAGTGPEIVFRLGKEGEAYQGIGKGDLRLEHMPVLADAAGPFGGPSSDSLRAMISAATSNALTVIYSFSGAGPLEDALALAVERFTTFASVRAVRQSIVKA